MVNVWLTGNEVNKEDTDIITKNRIVITDECEYKALMSDLKDFRRYICSKTGRVFNERYPYISSLGCHGSYSYWLKDNGLSVLYQDDIDRYWGDEPSLYEFYKNPRANLTALMNLEQPDYEYAADKVRIISGFNPDFALSSLINGEVSEMGYIINAIEQSNLSSEKKIELLNNSFIEFGYFITKCLDCIDFEVYHEYSISEIRARMAFVKKEIEWYEKFKGGKEHAHLFRYELKDCEKVLSQIKVAKENQRVLTLARKMNQALKK